MGENTSQAELLTELPAVVEITTDRLQVILSPRLGVSLKALDAPELLVRTAELGIKLNARGEAEVREFCRPRKGNRKPVVIARGLAPVDDTPPSAQLLIPLESTASRPVLAEEPVARLVPGSIGRDGVDVFGNPIPRKSADPFPQIGENLKLLTDGLTYAADIAGMLRARRQGPTQLISVVPTLSHKGDVTSDLGSLEYPGDISIEGSVRAGAIVRAGGCLQIGGDADADEILAGGDLLVGGSINSRPQSRYSIAGGLVTRAILGAHVEAGGDITVSTSIRQSRVICRGFLKLESGEIIESHITAAGGLSCSTIGSAVHGKTLIEVGIDDRLRQLAHTSVPEIAARRAKAGKIRTAIQQLTLSATPLTASQKIRVNALLLEADQLEYTAAQMTDDLRREYGEASARFKNEITIAAAAHPGVTLRFPGVETTLRLPIKGPCRIAARQCDGSIGILLFETGKTIGTPLELRHSSDNWLDTIKQMAA